MTPAEQAKQLYADDGDHDGFRRDVERFMLDPDSWVISDPEVFILFSRVQAEGLNCEGWFIWVLAGNFHKSLDYMPEQLPVIGWARRGVRRWWEFERFARVLGIE